MKAAEALEAEKKKKRPLASAAVAAGADRGGEAVVRGPEANGSTQACTFPPQTSLLVDTSMVGDRPRVRGMLLHSGLEYTEEDLLSSDCYAKVERGTAP